MGSAIRPVVLGCRSRLAAVTAVLALLLAAPYRGERACDVCPTDCPMHAARTAPERVGCHRGGDDAPPRIAPAGDHGACAMRASCGHRDGGVPSVVSLELPPALVVAPLVARPARPPVAPGPHAAEAPAPPDRPPKPARV